MTRNTLQKSEADKVLDVDSEHIWLYCFRTCARCSNLSELLTLYEFNDGSSIVLDSSHAFPQPVLEPRAKLRIA